MKTILQDDDQAVQQVAALEASAGQFLPPQNDNEPPMPLALAIIDATILATMVQRPSLRVELFVRLKRLATARYAAPKEQEHGIKLLTLQDEPIDPGPTLDEQAEHRRSHRSRSQRA